MSWPKQGIQLQRFFYLKSNWKREQNNRMKLVNETETDIHSKTNNMLALTVRLRFKVYKYNEMIYHNYTHTIISNHYKLWFVIRLFYMFSMQKNKRSSTIKPKSKEKKTQKFFFRLLDLNSKLLISKCIKCWTSKIQLCVDRRMNKMNKKNKKGRTERNTFEKCWKERKYKSIVRVRC